MSNGKIITGVAVGVLVALVMIPKTRKIISDALCTLRDSIKSFANEAEDIADSANDLAGPVKTASNVLG